MRFGDEAIPSDPDLIARTRTGDAEAYSALFERHRGAAQRLARQMARGESDADDLVAEAFTRVLQQLKGGKGPDVAFRAYLLTTLRHLHFRRHSAEKRMSPTDDLQVLDQPTVERDAVIEGFDNAAASRAFGSLPERWQMILWHLEVEGQRPAEVAELLGLKPNAVSALGYRAREALRQAYLLQHIADADNGTCVAVLELLPTFVRGKISRRDKEKVTRHLATCLTCPLALAEMEGMNSQFSAFLAPVVLGAAATPYLAGAAHGLSLLHHPWQWLQHWINFAPAKTIVVHKLIVSGAALVIAGGAVTGTVVSAYPDTAPKKSVGAPTTPVLAPPTTSAPAAPTPTVSATATPSTPAVTPTPTPTPSETMPPSAEATVAPLRASFTSTPSGTSVAFHASTTGGDGKLSYSWDLGDGSTATGDSVAHTYAGTGSYTVALTVTDGTQSTTTSRSVSVYATNEPPTASFTTSVSGMTVSVDGSASSDPDGSIASYAWDFGDDATATGASATHAYTVTGEYAVRLTVTDDRGTRTSRVATVEID